MSLRLALASLIAALVLGSAGAQPSARTVDVNEARIADLEQLRGIGPELSERIVALRQQRLFRDWADLIARVPGLGERSAAALSAQGLRVYAQPWTPTRQATPANAAPTP